MNFEDCLKKGLIRPEKISPQKIDASIKKASKFIDSAEFNLKNEFYDVVVIVGYNAIFSLNQALLFSKGYNENSHVCLIAAVRELYASNTDILDTLKAIDEARRTRHQIQYSGYNADAEMADFVVNLAKDYFDIVKAVLKC